VGLLERSYPGSSECFACSMRSAWTGAQSLGLGLLDPEELVRLTVQRFESSTFLEPAYNFEAGLWSWEREALSRFFPPAGHIVVGAGGAGREMVALHRAGYSVEGFECAHTLVAAGQTILRQAGCPGRLLWAPAGDPDLGTVGTAKRQELRHGFEPGAVRPVLLPGEIRPRNLPDRCGVAPARRQTPQAGFRTPFESSPHP
jgi:hypothetical protein